MYFDSILMDFFVQKYHVIYAEDFKNNEIKPNEITYFVGGQCFKKLKYKASACNLTKN